MNVFLSSTALDLGDYRKVADETILRLKQESIVMERFGPLSGTPVEECERLASECDVTVCIVAHRYGWIPEKGKGSITQREVEAAKDAGKDVLVWIVEDDYPWSEKKETDQLADPNVFNDSSRVESVREAVKGLSDFKSWLRTTFTPETFTTADDLGRKIAVALANYAKGHAAPPVPQDRISIARLPTTGAELFGREDELQLLDKAWANPNTNILSFVAWGGVGKTALVNHWLKKRMARDNYRGADRVYGWSFFSQGTSERAASADLFIDKALRWFGDSDPSAGSPWDKGERLARYIRQTRTLLILDGLEPLQFPPGPQEGRLKDAALQALLVELAGQQPGLCVISTRERVGDLVEFESGTIVQRDLEHLSPQAGAQILRSFNVEGDDEELEEASREMGGHGFSLTLLGSYLDEVFDADIRRRKQIENLFHDTRYGDAAQSMIAAYERWLGEGMELAILRLLGLFDRPADLGSLVALREPPAIPNLTEPLQQFKGREWSQAVAKLRRIKLLGEPSPNEPGTLDAHPLVREHFKQQLKRESADAWREANNRIYEHLKHTTKEFPDTVEEMSPLYAAVAHGCAAGRHNEALSEVYLTRILRGSVHFSWIRLGTFGADLAALSDFFVIPWELVNADLEDSYKAFVQAQAGFCLRARGRLQEAIRPMIAAVDLATANKHWKNAAKGVGNLSELYLILGNLPQALNAAEQGVVFAERSDDYVERITKQTTLANALHQAGRVKEALAAFGNAEAMQQQHDPKRPILYTLQGFQYCDLLLGQGQAQRVKERGQKMLDWRMPSQAPFSIAFEDLLLGRALLLEAKQEDADDTTQAAEFLQRAVDGLRAAGAREFIAQGLLARAELNRFTRRFEEAEHDLIEVRRIATRSGMGLYLADYHLESGRLQFAQGNREKTCEHLATAKQMIERMRYHRRDTEVAELEEQLA